MAWLIKLRWVAIAGTAVTLVLVHAGLGIPLALRPLYLVLVGLASYNALLSWVVVRQRWQAWGREAAGGRLIDAVALRVALAPVLVLTGWLALQDLARSLVGPGARRTVPPPARGSSLAALLVPRAWWGLDHGWGFFQAAAFASAQISLDLVALALLIHFAGGIENPVVFFCVFHVVISSVLLSRRATYLQATLGFGLVTAVALGEYFGVITHYPLAGVGRAGGYSDAAYVGGQLFVLGTTLFLCAYMAGTISARLRYRERETVLLSREVESKAAKLEEAYARLSRIEQEKSQYMRKVAHELRGPLGTIQTSLRVMLDGLAGEVPEGARELARRAERRAGELAQVTADLLALSRAREGRLAVELAPVDLARLLAELVQEMRETAERAGVTLTFERAANGAGVQGDAAALRQLAGNLLSNAIRYTPRGGSVRVRLSAIGDSLLLEVEDSGIGIPADDLPRIYDEFYRSPNARGHTADGTGLGLAIVKAAVEQHRGEIAVRSVVGEGTCFTVRLPAIRLDPAKAAPTAESAPQPLAT